MKPVREQLTELCACQVAVEWASPYDTLQDAWDNCERGDWMLWLADKKELDHKKIVSAACQCARLSLPHTDDPEVLKCIETTELWTQDKATLEEVGAAALAAAKAADAADAAGAAALAARAAAWAAWATGADTWTAWATWATDAADAAWAATWGADAAVLKECAKIVRSYFPTLTEE